MRGHGYQFHVVRAISAVRLVDGKWYTLDGKRGVASVPVSIAITIERHRKHIPAFSALVGKSSCGDSRAIVFGDSSAALTGEPMLCVPFQEEFLRTGD